MNGTVAFTECVEVTITGGRHDGLVIGYAIRLGGDWDGWSRRAGRGLGNGELVRVANGTERDDAIAAVAKDWVKNEAAKAGGDT